MTEYSEYELIHLLSMVSSLRVKAEETLRLVTLFLVTVIGIRILEAKSERKGQQWKCETIEKEVYLL